MASFEAVLNRFADSPIWGYHLPVPATVAEPFIEGDHRRVICTLEGEVKLHSSLMPREGDYFILINSKVRQQLQLKLGDTVQVELEKDRSEYGMPMPEELAVMLDQDEEAHALFHRLTPGKQRSLIYLVSKVKRTDSRIQKALAIVDHLKMAAGQLDFKELNERIKFYNRNS